MMKKFAGEKVRHKKPQKKIKKEGRRKEGNKKTNPHEMTDSYNTITGRSIREGIAGLKGL